MENQVYMRQYPRPAQETSPHLSNDVRSFLENVLSNDSEFQARIDSIPRHIIPEDVKSYHALLNQCDAIAQQYFGSVYGCIDNQKYEAKIKLTLNFFEINTGDMRRFFHDVLHKACSFCFEPAPNNQITLTIFFDYYAEDEEPASDSLYDFLINYLGSHPSN